MCGYLIVMGIPLVVAFFIGRAIGDGKLLEWRYRIVKRGKWYEVHTRSSLWPFWFDSSCSWSLELSEAQEKLKNLKASDHIIVVE